MIRITLVLGLALGLCLLAGTAAAGEPAPSPQPAAAPAPAPSDGTAVAAHRVPPKYPKKALKQKVDGCVALSFLLDAEGKASDYRVEQSLPQGMFDAAALKVIDQWRFKAPPRAGRYAQLMQFRLEGQAPVNVCAPLPGYVALNPGEQPLTRDVRLLQSVMPQLPRSADAADGGCVTVRFQVRHDGFVGDVTVIEARPQSLAEPTVAALKQWVFQTFPPPDMYATQTFHFTPELVRLPETMIRAAYADAEGNQVRAIGCGGKPAATEAKAKP